MPNWRSTKIYGVSATRWEKFYCIMDVAVKMWVFVMVVLGFGNWCFCTPFSLPNWKDQINGQVLPTNVSNAKKRVGTTTVMKQTITFLNDLLCSIWLLNNTIFTTKLLYTFKVTTKNITINHSLHAAGVWPTPLHTSPVVAT